MQSMLIESSHWQRRIDSTLLDMVSPEEARLARVRCADYFRGLGVRDPEVVARMTHTMLQRALEQLTLEDATGKRCRLCRATLEAAESWVQKWTAGIEKQIDLHGGVSRCGEVAVRMASVLERYPEAIESVDEAVVLFRKDRSLCMNAQPPNNPTIFAGQPLTASSRGIFGELSLTLAKAFAAWFPQLDRKPAS